MRVNVYAEEMTDRIEIIGKEIDGHTFTGLRFYLELPCTIPAPPGEGLCSIPGDETTVNVSGPFMHRPGDDDSAAVTFWGKRDLRTMLRIALDALDKHYGVAAPSAERILTQATDVERFEKCALALQKLMADCGVTEMIYTEDIVPVLEAYFPSSGGAAVVMPSEKSIASKVDSIAGLDDWAEARGWNACLAEFRRLNSGAASEKPEDA